MRKILPILFIVGLIFTLYPKPTSSSMVPTINPAFLVKATYYCPNECCNGMWAGFTKTGKPLKYGVVAIDPEYWKMGQQFKLKNLDDATIFTAEDVGSAIKGKYRMDICVNTHAETLLGHPEQILVELIK